jgi:hypothetical protein
MTKSKKSAKDQKKTAAKRIGISGTYTYGDGKIAIIAFGKGNDARVAIETDSIGSNLAATDKERNITAKRVIPKRGIEVTGTTAKQPRDVLLSNPADRAGEDYLKLKPVIEAEFFHPQADGLNNNDNIRIQIIHNILDVQKLLGIYVNDVIYTINNLRDEESLDEASDIVGLSMTDKNVNAAIGQMRPYFGFFGEAFQPVNDDKGKEITLSPEVQKKLDKIAGLEEQARSPLTPRFKQENIRMNLDELKKGFKDARSFQTAMSNYRRILADGNNVNVLRILGAMRQITAHFRSKALLFCADFPKVLKKEYSKADWQIVENHYAKLVKRIGENFAKNSALNIKLLEEILTGDTVAGSPSDELVEEYYRFSILKEGKNLGVNMKKLREIMFALFLPEIQDKKDVKVNSYRAKIYALSDFIIFRTFGNSADLQNMVAVLRETQDEKAKETLYDDFAKEAWRQCGTLLKAVCEKLKNYFAKDAVKSRDLPEIRLQANRLNNCTPFAKLLAFLTNFWDGKEINELLSAYIHKFESIQSLLDTAKQLGVDVTFTDKYALFNENNGKRAGEIAANLRVLISIGKMKQDLSGAKRQLYKAAIETLGIEGKTEKDDKGHNVEYFHIGGKWHIATDWIDDFVMAKDTSVNEHQLAFKNFIEKQVIQSRRFQYLVKYTKPKTVRAVMSNRAVVHYVLSRIADIKDHHVTETQIDRYYQNLPESARQDVAAQLENKVNALADYLLKFSFEEHVLKQKAGIVLNTKSKTKNVQIENLKALTGLYLTVAFIAVKNLVKANARYYIAFAAWERDYHFFCEKCKDDANFQAKTPDGKYDNYLAMTEYLLANEPQLQHFPQVEKGKWSWKEFREHCKKQKGHYEYRWQEILRNNLAEANKVSPSLQSWARNQAEHLNVLTALPKYIADFTPMPKMTSYFQLYHYMIQRLLCEKNGCNLGDLPKQLKTYHKPNLDFVKYCYVSLAYNLPRYKNLTVEKLFDEDADV